MQNEIQNQQDVLEQIQIARKKLLDLSMRNSLLNFKHLEKGKNQIRFVDVDLASVYESLVAGRSLTLEPSDLNNEMDLKENRYDLPMKKGTLFNDKLPTLLSKEELKKRVKSLRRLIKSDFEEKGCNTFYMAFGFLKWVESEGVATAQNTHEAPLLMMKLSPIQEEKNGSYTISDAEDEIIFNLSLKKKLEEFSLVLPEFQETDTIDAYLQKVAEVVKDKPNWAVKRYLTMGRFIFTRLAMYEDLDIDKNWPNIFNLLAENKALMQLFLPKELPVALKTYDIDKDKDVETFAPMLVTDADSSQHSAITDVLKGKSLVIKGPPGTGKSQTITNIIANALHQNKKVLFISEKKAALDVVYNRLSKAGLKDFCLELHSDKTNLKNIKSDLATSYDKYCRGNYEIFNDEPVFSSSYDKVEDLKETKLELRKYYDLLEEKFRCQEISIFDAIWQEKENAKSLKSVPTAVKNLKIPEPSLLKKEELDEILTLLEQYETTAQKLKQKEDEATGFTFKNIKMEEVNPLFEQVEELIFNLKEKHDLFIKESSLNQLNINESILNYKKLFFFIEVLLEKVKSAKINPKLLPLFKNETLKSTLFEIEKNLQELNKKETFLKENISDLKAFCLKREEIETQYLSLEPIFDKLSLEQKREIETLFNALKSVHYLKTIYLSSFEKVHEILFQGQPFSVKSFLFIKSFFDVFKTITPLELSLIKKPFIQNKKYKPTLEELILSYEKIKEKMDELTPIFYLEKINSSASSILKMKQIFETKNCFSFLNKEYRNAKNLLKSWSKTDEEKAVNALENLSIYLELCFAFQNNKDYALLLQEDFLGLETPVSSIKKACALYEELDGLKNLLFEKMNLLHQKALENKNINEAIDIAADFEEEGEGDLSLLTPLFEPDTSLQIFLTKTQELYEKLKIVVLNLSLYKKEELSLSDLKDLFKKAQDFISLKERVQQELTTLNLKEIDLVDETYFDEKTAQTLFYVKELETQPALKEEAIFHLKNENILTLLNDLNMKLSKVKEICELFDASISFIEKNVAFKEEKEGFSSLKEVKLDTLKTKAEMLFTLKDEVYDLLSLTSLKEKILLTKAGSFLTLALENKVETNLKQGFLALFYKSLLTNLENEKWQKFIPDEFENLKNKVALLDKEIFPLFKERLIKSLSLKIDKDSFLPEIQGNNTARFGCKTELSLLKHQVFSQAKNMPLRTFINRAGKALQLLKPCFLMSPISLAQYIKTGSVEFDLLIIDEASQMYFEEALGALLRTKQFVVVGDEKQLPPTPFFQKLTPEDEEIHDDDFFAEGSISVLETMIVRGFEVRELLWHYRSKEAALINFSNKYFYKNNLNVFPTLVVPRFRKEKKAGIVLHKIEGIYQNRQNEIEADLIAQNVLKFILEKPHLSLGVATMNIAQARLIEDKIDTLKEQYPEIKPYFATWEANHEAFFVKNLENVQGDERDYIFISTGYGPASLGEKVSQNFGPINSKNGARRLNVLFTRARYGIDLFTSLSSSDIKEKTTFSEGLHVFKKYLEYAENGYLETTEVQAKPIETGFYKTLLTFLNENGYQADIKVGMNGFYIDIAVLNQEDKTTYDVALEIDVNRSKPLYSARDKECTRPSVLKMLGWRQYRIWSKDWFYNEAYEKEKLLTFLNQKRQ